MKRIVPSWVLLLPVLVLPSVARAQEPRAYVGGTFATAAWQRAPALYNDFENPAFDTFRQGTNASGVVAETGWLFGRLTSVGVEIGVPLQRTDVSRIGTLPGRQEFSGVSHYREQSILGVVSRQLRQTERVRLAVVGGGGIVHGSSHYRLVDIDNPSADLPGYLVALQKVSYTFWGVIGGTDLSIKTTSHISLVPQFRALMIARRPALTESNRSHLGLPSVVFRGGIGIRVAF